MLFMKRTILYYFFLCFAISACTNDVEENDNYFVGIDRDARQLMKSSVSKKEFENKIINNAWKIVKVDEINIEASNSNGYVLFDIREHRVSGPVAYDCYFKGNNLRSFVDDMAFAEPAFCNYTYIYDEVTGGVFITNDEKETKNKFAFMYIDKLEEQNLYTIYRLEYNDIPHYYYCHYVMMNNEELEKALRTYTYEIK